MGNCLYVTSHYPIVENIIFTSPIQIFCCIKSTLGLLSAISKFIRFLIHFLRKFGIVAFLI